MRGIATSKDTRGSGQTYVYEKRGFSLAWSPRLNAIMSFMACVLACTSLASDELLCT